MNTSIFRLCFLAIFVGLITPSAWASDYPFFHSEDPLANRDEWGAFHQMPRTNPVDYAPRGWNRLHYYWKSRNELVQDPAYVGALQVA